jgi:hypothetical protein
MTQLLENTVRMQLQALECAVHSYQKHTGHTANILELLATGDDAKQMSKDLWEHLMKENEVRDSPAASLIGEARGQDKNSSAPWDGSRGHTASVFHRPPTGPEWESFAQIHLNESAVLKDAHVCDPPKDLTSKLSEQTKKVILSSLQVGRPFGLGMTNDYWHPIGRIHKLLANMVAKHHAHEFNVGQLTCEMTLAMIIHSWDSRHSTNPFEVLVCPRPGDTTNQNTYVRAKQSLIRDKALAPDGGPTFGQKSSSFAGQGGAWDNWKGKGGGSSSGGGYDTEAWKNSGGGGGTQSSWTWK